MRNMLFASVSSAAVVAFMSSDTCPTVIVKMNGANVRINESDYDAKEHGKIVNAATEDQPEPVVVGAVTAIPDGAIIPPAPSAPNFAPAGEQPPAAPVPPTVPSPGAKLVMKKGKKYIVVDTTGAAIVGAPGIDEAGYDTEELAIYAINHPPQDAQAQPPAAPVPPVA